MQAILDKLFPSLRQMSYPVCMTMMRGKMQFLMIIYVLCNSYAMFSFKLFMKIASFLVFFGIRNLTKKGET